MAGHWPVIVAGGRAGAPDPSISVLCCIDIIVAISLLLVRTTPVVAIAISLTICDGLVSDSRKWCHKL